jgi:hypothetical protein
VKAYLRRIPLALCLVLSTAVVAVWGRSYIVADRYRWSSLHDHGGNTALTGGFMVTGIGGVAVSYAFESTSDPDRAAFLKERAEIMARAARNSFNSNRAPRYPVPGNPDDSLLSSLGFYWAHYAEGSDDTRRVNRFVVTIPFWAIFTVTMSYPLGLYVAGVLRRQREDRLALGLCPRCGVAMRDECERCPGCDRPMPTAFARHAS